MDISNILTAIGTVVGVWIAIYTVLRNFKTDVNNKFDDVNRHLDRIDSALITQGKRTDHLYEICIGLLKENRK